MDGEESKAFLTLENQKKASYFILILGKNRRKKLDKSEYEWYYNKAV